MAAKNRRHHHHSHAEDAEAQPELSAHEQTERLAYQFWEQRGCPLGSPDEDWFHAERELSRQREAATHL